MFSLIYPSGCCHISKKLNPALHHIQPFIELPPNPARAASWESGHFLAMLFSYLERFVSYFLSSLVSKLAQKCCILLLLLYQYCSACRHLMAKASHALTVYPRGPLLTALGIRKNSRLSIRPLKPTFYPTWRCLWQPGCTWCSELAQGSQLAVGCIKSDSYPQCSERYPRTPRDKVRKFRLSAYVIFMNDNPFSRGNQRHWAGMRWIRSSHFELIYYNGAGRYIPVTFSRNLGETFSCPLKMWTSLLVPTTRLL